MTKKQPRLLCQICDRSRPINRFSMWGETEAICVDCEREILSDVDTDAPPKSSEETVSVRVQPKLKDPVPYRDLDPNIVSLVRALNRYPGVETLGSCGGHEVTTNESQWEAGTWYVKFTLPWDRTGWYVMEHLAWAINNDYSRGDHKVIFMPKSPPPFLNTPGECLAFVIEGFGGEDPDELAQFLVRTLEYLTPEVELD